MIRKHGLTRSSFLFQLLLIIIIIIRSEFIWIYSLIWEFYYSFFIYNSGRFNFVMLITGSIL
jgi:hypothetical protein